MKRIDKGQEPEYLTSWRSVFHEANGRAPFYRDFRGTNEWRDLIQDLLMEQGFICCYCTQEVNGWDSHIEHLIPRDIKNKDPYSIRAEDVELRYDNMCISCNGDHGNQEHCGRFKDKDNTPMFLSPLAEDVERRFGYKDTGEIDGIGAEAMTTIRVLNLNCYALKRQRISALRATEFYDDDFEEYRDSYIDFYSARDEKGAFSPFCTYIIWHMINNT